MLPRSDNQFDYDEKLEFLSPSQEFNYYNELGVTAINNGNYEKALSLLNRAIAMKPNDHSVKVNLLQLYMAQGESAIAEKKYEEAERFFNKANEFNITPVYVHKKLAILYVLWGHFELENSRHLKAQQLFECAQHYDKTREFDGAIKTGFQKVSFINGRLALQNQDLVKAGEYFNSAKIDSLFDEIFLSSVADCYVEYGQAILAKQDLGQACNYFEAASKWFQLALIADPRNKSIKLKFSNLLMIHGQILLKLQRFFSAEEKFQRIAGFRLASVDSRFGLAKALSGQTKGTGKYDLALASYRELLAEELSDSQRQEITASYVDFLKSCADDFWVGFLHGTKVEELYNRSIAIDFERQAFDLDELNVDALIHKIAAHAATLAENLSACISDIRHKEQKDFLLNEIKKLFPTMQTILLRQYVLQENTNLGGIFWRKDGSKAPSLEKGRLKKAKSILDKLTDSMRHLDPNDFTALLQADPTNPDTYYRRGLERLKAGQYVAATLDFDRTILLESHVAWRGYYSRAKCYLALGKQEEALADFQKAIELRADDQWVYIDYRGALIDSGNKIEAELMAHILEIANELEAQKDKKRYVLNRIKQLPKDEALLLLLKIKNNQTILGAVMWAKENGEKPSLDKGILNEVVNTIADLQLSEEDKEKKLEAEWASKKEKKSLLGGSFSSLFREKQKVDAVTANPKPIGLKNNNSDSEL